MAVDDILNDDKEDKPFRIEVNRIYSNGVDFARDTIPGRTTSLKPAKNLQEVYDLVRQAIENYQQRANTPEENKIYFVEGNPDKKIIDELGATRKGGMISFSLIRRQPGAMGQGGPFEADVKNLKPMFREERNDPDNPGYKLSSMGYFHDNIIRFTCWAQTNKKANQLAQWFEDLMDEYMWYFKAEGVNRFLFWNRDPDTVENIDNNKWYGRPIDYFVRTEKIKVFSEKTIEKIVLSIVVKEQE